MKIYISYSTMMKQVNRWKNSKETNILPNLKEKDVSDYFILQQTKKLKLNI